jgi:hypothetical protein
VGLYIQENLEMKKSFAKLALALVLAGAAASFNAQTVQAACGDGNACPAVYDPVICNDGVIYSNACYAREACAHGCKPYNPVA